MSEPDLSHRLLRVAMLGVVPSDDPHVIADAQAELERLRKRGDILHEALVDIISYRCNGWNHACEIARKAMDDAMHAYEQSARKE
jgi:hypothetical protein